MGRMGEAFILVRGESDMRHLCYQQDGIKTYLCTMLKGNLRDAKMSTVALACSWPEERSEDVGEYG